MGGEGRHTTRTKTRSPQRLVAISLTMGVAAMFVLFGSNATPTRVEAAQIALETS
jgi:hypothetical protein